MGLRIALEREIVRESYDTEHMQVYLWPFYFMYLNPRRILQIASGHLKLSFCKVVMKSVLQRCFLPRKFVILVSGLPEYLA